MNFKPVLLSFFASACASVSHAAVECRVICSGAEACVDASVGKKTAKGWWKIDQCDAGNVKTLSSATVWYSKDSIPARKDLAPGMLLASAVADGDRSCYFMTCLLNPKLGSVSGGSPMSSDRGDRAVNRDVVDAGLPFDDVELPEAGLAFTVEPAGGGGTFVLIDDGRRRSYPAPGGRVLVPRGDLEPGNAYTYQWSGATGALDGGFMVARNKTVKRARDAASAAAGSDPNAENRKLALAGAYLSAGLRWNARRLLLEIERGQ